MSEENNEQNQNNSQNIPNVIPSKEEIERANQAAQKEKPTSEEVESTPLEQDPDKQDKESEAEKEMQRRREEEVKKRQEAVGTSHSQEDFQKFDSQPLDRSLEEPKSPMEDTTTSERMKEGEFNEYAKEKDGELPAGDYIGLPSDGKIYKHGKDRIRVAYLTAADENILTSPNLLESGEFLKVLLNRKIIDEDIHYEDLHIGDRNAILIWLRATGYGTIYPVELTDPATGEDFETEIDLSELDTKELKVNPDQDGLFHYKLPVSNSSIRFKLLTIRDSEDIEAQVHHEREILGYKIDNTITYTLKKHIKEVDGKDDRPYINWFVDNMRVGDSRALRKYINDIEPGIDLNVTVRTPGGESITRFLPIGPNFFWPDIIT